MFVVDLSDSVGNEGREDALAFLRETLEVIPDGDVAGIVAFGKEALVERLPSDLDAIDRIASTPVRSASDIGAALRLATALFPDDAQKRIVLLSDGNDTSGRGQAEAALAATRDIRIETRLIGLGTSDEVLIERLTTPSTANLGESVEAVAEIRSTVAQPATVRLFVNGEPAGDAQSVHLEAGLTRVVFDVDARRRPGSTRSGSSSRPRRDTFSENDRADSNTIVKGEPRTLVLAGDAAGRGRARGRAREPAPARRQHRARRRCRPTSGRSRPTTASSSSTCRGPACRTASWPRCRSTSATSARAW